ncbi:MAG: hypothetical protein GXO82_06525 [Chlorobi bacterium]|nr:hypothetical protein [Chlorobiota bacterium]
MMPIKSTHSVSVVDGMEATFFNAKMRELILSRKDPFGFERLRYIMSVSESKAPNNVRGPIIIISASGMAEGGRVLHHLRNNIKNERNTIMITGYCNEELLIVLCVLPPPSSYGEQVVLALHSLRLDIIDVRICNACLKKRIACFL